MKRLVVNGVTAAALIAAAPAHADVTSTAALNDSRAKSAPQPVPMMCADYATHAKYLARRFGEHPVFTGQAAPGMLVRIMANTATGSWTMLLIRQDGTSCVRGVGRNGRREVGL